MKRNTLKKIFTAVFAVLFLAIILGISWGGTIGVIYLITLCFGLTFKLSMATGIWMILLLVLPAIKPNVTIKK